MDDPARWTTFWRDSAISAGACVLRSAAQYAADVSLPSAGRHRYMLGVVRRDSMISTGWWVGPSSPKPMESWVAT